MAKLELFLLGTPQVYVDQQAITTFNTRKDLALLIYLAVTRTTHSRESLAGLLWSELPEANARRNLRHALTHLQKVIGSQWLVTEHGIALTQKQPWSVDIHTLRSLIKKLPTGPLVANDRTVGQTVAALPQLLELYRGEFLQGFYLNEAVYFEEWLLAQREELRLLAMRGLETMAQVCLAQNAYDQGLLATHHLLQLEPWSEPTYRLQMQLLARSGQRTAALAQYEKCRTLLASELGVEPEPATVALYQQLLSGQMGGEENAAPYRLQPTSANPLPRVATSPPYINLPGQLTRLIGRSTDVVYIRNLLLSPERHLVTVVGEGGVGKTRVALAVAQSFVDEVQALSQQPVAARQLSTPAQPLPFPDGIVFVALAGLTATALLVEQLATTVAEALRLQFDNRFPLLQQLQDYLSDKALLLLIDNVEHLLPEAADFLVALLQAAPQLKLLVTSRHLLNLQAESMVRLAGLLTPPTLDDAILSPTALLTYSSVALFVERAQRTHPTFQLTPTNQDALVQICRFVGGLPLAIELAATQARKSSCQQILTELQQSYTVLTSTQRDLAPRHRSIRAMLDYSWQFLSPEAAYLLAACSLFRGTFSSAAVTTIVGATSDDLFLLVDQSLVQWIPGEGNDTQGRFALHELIRQYGAEQLQRQPAAAQRLGTAHCHYYLTLLIAQSQRFVQDLETLQQLQRELDNLRTAWEWAVAQGEGALLTASAYPLRQFYDLLSLSHEAERTFGRTIAQIQQQDALAATQQDRLVAQLLAHQAHFYEHMDQFTQAEELAQAALALGQQVGDSAVQVYAYLSLSTMHGRRTYWADAQRAAQQALVHTRTLALSQAEAQSLQNIGCSYLYSGEVDRALDYLHQAFAANATGANLYIEGWICIDLGNAYQIAGDLMQAHTYYKQAVAIYHRMSIPMLGVYALACLSELDLQLGCFAQARANAQMAWEIGHTIGRRTAEAAALSHLLYADYYLGDWANVDHYCRLLLERIKSLGVTFTRPFAYWLQGELYRNQKQWQAALAAYELAYQDYTTMKQTARMVSTQAKMAQVWQQMGEVSNALALVEAILPQLLQPIQSSWPETTADYLICYQVLTAAHDPRAAVILHHGYHHIKTLAATITDAELRHSYLTKVPANRTLVELAAGLQPDPLPSSLSCA